MFAFNILLMINKSSVLLMSLTIPEMLKNRSIKELEALIFRRINWSSNNLGMLTLYFFQNSAVELVHFISFSLPNRLAKWLISESSSLLRAKIAPSLLITSRSSIFWANNFPNWLSRKALSWLDRFCSSLLSSSLFSLWFSSFLYKKAIQTSLSASRPLSKYDFPQDLFFQFFRLETLRIVAAYIEN